MFATLAKQERARISERTIVGLKVARAKGKIIGRPPLPEETVQKVLLLNRHEGIGARKIAKSTGYPLGDSQCNFGQIPTADLLSNDPNRMPPDPGRSVSPMLFRMAYTQAYLFGISTKVICCTPHRAAAVLGVWRT